MFCLLGFTSFLMPAYCLCLTQKIQPLMYSELNNQRRFPVCEKIEAPYRLLLCPDISHFLKRKSHFSWV